MIVSREAHWKTFSLKNQQLDNVIILQITDNTGQLFDLQKKDYIESFNAISLISISERMYDW